MQLASLQWASQLQVTCCATLQPAYLAMSATSLWALLNEKPQWDGICDSGTRPSSPKESKVLFCAKEQLFCILVSSN